MDSIFHRISVRRYEDKHVEKEKLMQILRAGMQAPSACNQRVQPAAVGILCGDESGKDQSAFQSDALCGMCSERAGRNRACISEGRTDCSGFCTD